MIDDLIHALIGGAVGWLTIIVMNTTAKQKRMLNIVFGILGALLAGRLVPGGSIAHGVTMFALFVLVAGAVVLIVEINLLVGGRRR